jgi:hypothetical protein
MIRLIFTILFILAFWIPSNAQQIYITLPPHAALPDVSLCIDEVNNSPTPETAPWNIDDGTGYNSNLPPSENIPDYFYEYAPGGSELPASDFSKVDGNYTGSTNDLIRITACKWGINENYIRAQAWIESGWHQDCAAAHGGTDCNEGGDLNNPPGDPETPLGIFTGFDNFGGANHYDSWSMLQTKVYYDWMTWPMIEESNPFGLDFRFAEMRGCLNGDQYDYFDYQSHKSGKNYINAVNKAINNPNKTSSVSKWNNLEYLAYGCIDTHYSGDWFNGNKDEYLKNFLNALNNEPWN